MEFCQHCGTQLVKKALEHEGQVPYCENCQAFRFPQHDLAVSMIVYDEPMQRILLIQQYHMRQYILVAGYVNKGEKLEEAVKREVLEETCLTVEIIAFNASSFYEKNQVLMVNFICRAKKASDLKLNHEVEAANWFHPDQAKEAILSPSLAKNFLLNWLDKKSSLNK
ncbi:NAD(+) diphosphatase [Streptococcus mutans]|uniref:NAD(+) diphosphatase n=1 Tax=Streptococcus mutans TaxID=1309 RepID=UPI0002E9AFC1|nr:NAD(+) diphosphatase [Streptococcus mutans]